MKWDEVFENDLLISSEHEVDPPWVIQKTFAPLSDEGCLGYSRSHLERDFKIFIGLFHF